MSNRIEMVSASAAAHDISQAANLVYWLSSPACPSKDTADYHERDLHDHFRKLAALLGYSVSPITSEEPADAGLISPIAAEAAE